MGSLNIERRLIFGYGRAGEQGQESVHHSFCAITLYMNVVSVLSRVASLLPRIEIVIFFLVF